MVTTGDIVTAHPEIWPFSKAFSEYYQKFARPLPAPILPHDPGKLRDAFLVIEVSTRRKSVWPCYIISSSGQSTEPPGGVYLLMRLVNVRSISLNTHSLGQVMNDGESLHMGNVHGEAIPSFTFSPLSTDTRDPSF